MNNIQKGSAREQRMKRSFDVVKSDLKVLEAARESLKSVRELLKGYQVELSKIKMSVQKQSL